MSINVHLKVAYRSLGLSQIIEHDLVDNRAPLRRLGRIDEHE